MYPVTTFIKMKIATNNSMTKRYCKTSKYFAAPFKATAVTIKGKVKAENPGLKSFFMIFGRQEITKTYKSCDRINNPSNNGRYIVSKAFR